ncbi:hypothetical protein AJ79_08290 [Helicocarpus griseus UAMH5409]|uniref:Uncharacterized protein n=1 Tax=Helicocarpus griseus UAMH5409 TaxID=1447875 RepID=A0A2B7WU26_9EURO|nr:hypothetical protein AJ79_08290 [Helicocarpus griseus UAMH5409]
MGYTYRPERNELYEDFDVDLLDTPKDSKTLYDRKARHFDVSKLKALVDYHGWGFTYTIPRGKKHALFSILVRIHYNQRGDLRPSKDDFFNCTSDAGPLLLIAKYGALPISRRYPAGFPGMPIPPPTQKFARSFIPQVRPNALSEHHGEMAEYARSAILRFPYRQLERRLTSVFTDQTPFIFKKIQPGAVPVLSVPQGNGIQYPCRGYGPASCDTGAIDCAIVAANLLNAGYTVADRLDNPNWYFQLEPQEKLFLSMMYMDWGELWCGATCIGYPSPWQETVNSNRDKLKDYILQDLIKNREEYDSLQHLEEEVLIGAAVGWVWKSCAKSFGQLKIIDYSQQAHHAPEGQNPGNRRIPRSSCFMKLCASRDDGSNNSIQAQMANFFEKGYGTKSDNGCPGVVPNIHKLPLRLAVLTDTYAPPKFHTADNIPVKYKNSNGDTRNATYRWLGGIYPIKQNNTYRFRVFWNDHERFETDKGKIRMYDGAQLNGIIVGGIDSENKSERVPISWWSRGQSALLFYEQVLTPEPESLQAALYSVSRVMDHARVNNPIIQSTKEEHLKSLLPSIPSTPFTPSRKPLPASQKQSSSGPYPTNTNDNVKRPQPSMRNALRHAQGALNTQSVPYPSLQRFESRRGQSSMGPPQPPSLKQPHNPMQNLHRGSTCTEDPRLARQINPYPGRQQAGYYRPTHYPRGSQNPLPPPQPTQLTRPSPPAFLSPEQTRRPSPPSLQQPQEPLTLAGQEKCITNVSESLSVAPQGNPCLPDSLPSSDYFGLPENPKWDMKNDPLISEREVGTEDVSKELAFCDELAQDMKRQNQSLTDQVNDASQLLNARTWATEPSTPYRSGAYVDPAALLSTYAASDSLLHQPTSAAEFAGQLSGEKINLNTDCLHYNLDEYIDPFATTETFQPEQQVVDGQTSQAVPHMSYPAISLPSNNAQQQTAELLYTTPVPQIGFQQGQPYTPATVEFSTPQAPPGNYYGVYAETSEQPELQESSKKRKQPSEFDGSSPDVARAPRKRARK